MRGGVVETVLNGGDFDGYTARGRVTVQDFGVVLAWLKSVLLAHDRVYRPEVDRE